MVQLSLFDFIFPFTDLVQLEFILLGLHFVLSLLFGASGDKSGECITKVAEFTFLTVYVHTWEQLLLDHLFQPIILFH